MNKDDCIKVPPHSIEAEKSILGNLIRSPYLLTDAIGQLSDIDFYRLDHREIFNCLKSIHNEGITNYDMLLVHERLAKKDNVDRDDSFLWVANLANTFYSENCFQSHLSIVLDKSKSRQAISMLNETSNKLFRSDISAMEFLRNELSKIEMHSSVEIVSYNDILEKTLEQIDIEANRGTELVGLSSGIETLDFYTNGFQPGQLIVVGARTSVGKSVFMLNIAEHIGINLCKPTIVFSLEMSAIELTKRTISRFSRVKGVFTGKVLEDDWRKIEDSLEVIEDSKLFINDRAGTTTGEIRSYCRKVKSSEGSLAAIFIDYLGLMNGEGENEVLRLGQITKELKILAKDLGVPIVLLCQLNRENVKRADSSPQLFDLRQSGCIEQDADIVILLHRVLTETKLIVNVAKQRNGKVGSFEMRFNAEYFEFKEVGQ